MPTCGNSTSTSEFQPNPHAPDIDHPQADTFKETDKDGGVDKPTATENVSIAISWSAIYGLEDGQLLTSSRVEERFPGAFQQMCSTHGLAGISCGWRSFCAIDNQQHSCHILDSDSIASSTDSSEQFSAIVTNDISTLAISLDRCLYAINHQEDSKLLVPRPLLLGLRVRAVSCGKHHTLLLSAIGVVFSMGGGGQGQLGHGGIDSEAEPRIVEALEGVTMTSVAAGGWHSMALGDTGDVYVWGWNERGQLGLPCSSIAGKKDSTKKFDITAGDGKVDEKDDFVNVLTVPHVLDLPISNAEEVSVIRIAAGSRHSVALLDDGTVVTWGWNEYGQLGHGDIVSRDFPLIVEFFREQNMSVVNIFAGNWNSIFVCNRS